MTSLLEDYDFPVSSPAGGASTSASASAYSPDLQLEIEGMMCQNNCAKTVREAILSVSGVREAVVTFATREAQVWLSSSSSNNSSSNRTSLLETIIDAVESVGYDVIGKTDCRATTTTTTNNSSNNNNNYYNSTTSSLILDGSGHSSAHSVQSGNGNENGNSRSGNADITLCVKGMDNARDLIRVEDVLKAIEGVTAVEIYASKQVVDVYGCSDFDIMIRMLKLKGFAASLPKAESTLNPLQGSSKIDGKKNAKSERIKASMKLDLKQLGLKHDINKVCDSLSHLAGIDTEVDFPRGQLIISYNDMKMSQQQVIDILSEKQLGPYLLKQTTSSSLGNESTRGQKREFVYAIRGMSCGACAVKIEKALKLMPGIVDSAVSVMTHQGRAVIDDAIPSACGPRDVMEKIKSLGYECSIQSNDSKHNSTQDGYDAEVNQWKKLLYISLFFGIPVLFFHFVGHASTMLMMFLMQPALCGDGIQLGQLLMFLLNFPILVLVGFKYYKSALMGAMNGLFGMDFLVMTGSSITFAYSLVQLVFACKTGISTEHIFFETTGMLLMFVTIGKYIEAYAKGKSASSMAELLKLQPTEAYLVSGASSDRINSNDSNPLVDDSDVQCIDVDLIQKGDIVKVFPGGRIPTDGTIVLGTTHIDESMITGESNPVFKTKGDEVFGSTVNQDTCIYVSVTSYGTESALAQIVRLVESAQMNKAPVQEYADRIAGIFTPIILLIATLTFLVWLTLSYTKTIPSSWFEDEYKDPVLFSLLFAISVVVISCPCALGLATPTAIMVGTTVGAQNGILIKGGSAFELAHKIDTIIFDKTGTLTEGKPSVTDVMPIDPKNSTVLPTPASIVMLAATAEQSSEHPIAKAIMKSAKEIQRVTPLPLAENAALSFVGSGVSCESSMGRILVGNRTFMKSQNLILSPIVDSTMWNLEIQGKTAICVALNEDIHGVLGVADVPKPEADDAIKQLRALGMDVWMLTGDNQTTAQALANKLDISQDHVLAGMFPRDKARKVKELQEAGHLVAMIGDGVNDSPALAQADLGVAIGAGTQIAMEAASMVLIRSNLHDLVVAFDLAKVVFRRIQWNFLWAVIYNFISVPLAAGVWFPWTHMTLPPHYAGLAMALSSISVVFSSMLLKLYKRPEEKKRRRRLSQLFGRRTTAVDYDTLPADSLHSVEMGQVRQRN